VAGSARANGRWLQCARPPKSGVLLVLTVLAKARTVRFKFRRQHIVAGFVVDLYCPAARLAIEVDGPVHESQQHYDEARDAVFDSLGIAVIRVSNDDVLHRLGQVREVILRACSTRVRQDSNDQPRDG